MVLETELVPSRERHRTNPLTFAMGDRLDWVIGHRLFLSQVSVLR